jgi:hypothetical protein
MHPVNSEVDDVLTVQVPPGPALVLAFPYFFEPADGGRRGLRFAFVVAHGLQVADLSNR